MRSVSPNSYKEVRTLADSNNIKSVDVAIPLGISYEMGKLVADARYNFGLTEVRLRSQFSVFQFTVGYRFDLIKGRK